MKKPQLNIVLILLFSMILSSCSSDDDSSSIDCPKVNDTHPLLLGNWIFTGTYIDGELLIEDCDLLTTLKITCENIEIKNFGGDNCTTTSTFNSSYRIEGNNIISLDEFGNDDGAQIIITLDETTLILQNDFAVSTNITENWERQ